MSNILDYLDWRGDLTFDRDPLNEVDALIFAWITYYSFEQLNSSVIGKTFAEAAQMHIDQFGAFPQIDFQKTAMSPVCAAAELLKHLSSAARYADLRIEDFCVVIHEGTQFGALTVCAGDQRIIAFRGTDASIIGWREDCDLSFSEEVPAQHLAVKYLNDAAGTERLIVCGHSKGGNLAVYAAVNTSTAQRDRIDMVYNFDGPGFCYDISEREGYKALRSRMVKVVPEDSIVGMLLEDDDVYRVIDSDCHGIVQHNGIFWHVLGTHFVDAPKRTTTSLVIDETLHNWINSMPLEERREFINVLFTVIESTGVKDFDELDNNALFAGRRMLSSIKTLTPEQKKMALQLLMRLLKAWTDSVIRGSDETPKKNN